ncbi:MAG: adenylate/guanylate cyclase domain-containing protein [Peptococcaceae bacterium]|nr:adenylate/guanylate cyclase domain-containing protein [Peptococcaceae bacterium]
MEGLADKLKSKLVAAALIALVSIAGVAGLWERQELALYDAWFKLRGERPAPAEVVVVAMDDRSIRELGILPWPRRIHARLVEGLGEARVIGFDVLFDTPGTPEDNARLAAAMKAHGRVVLAAQFSFEREGGNTYQTPVFPVRQLAAAAAGIGFINTPEDLDNVVRRLTVADVNYFKRPFPCFSLAVLLAERGLTPDHLGFAGESTLAAGEMLIPLDRKNQALIDFWGPAGTFKTYSYVDVLEGRVSREELAGKIVLVGPTAAAEQDFMPTPFTRGNMVLAGALPSPGVEVHASAVGTFLAGGFYQRAPLPVNLAFLLLTGSLAAFAVYRAGSPWRGFLYLLALMTAAAFTVYLAWYYGHYWINLVSPLALAMLIYTGVTAENLVRTELERRRTRALFARYVSPAVVEELLQHREDIALGGARMELTVLFSDIRGFTSFSENRPPEYIVQRLNEYFTEMTAVIFKHGGTLDKYLGDGMMAFFGAPVRCEDHADRALAAAVEMVERLEKLNKGWREKGEPAMDIGIGINSGPVVVGNVGSPDRMDYTIIGEDVNLASRLEGLNKEYNTRIIVSDRTVGYLKHKDRLPGKLSFLGEASVRGMAVPVGVYTLEIQKMLPV